MRIFTLFLINRKAMKETMEKSTFVCCIDDIRFNKTIEEFLLHVQVGMRQGGRKDVGVCRASVLMTSNEVPDVRGG